MQERYTKQAENVLALAKQAASSCGHSYIGTEHLLVGLVEEKEGTAGRVLEEFGIQADKTMALIDELIAPAGKYINCTAARDSAQGRKEFWKMPI